MELPLWNEKRYAPYKVAALVEVLAEQGIAPEASLSGTGLSPESLGSPETLTSVRQYITVCETRSTCRRPTKRHSAPGSAFHYPPMGCTGLLWYAVPLFASTFRWPLSTTGSRHRFFPCPGVKKAITRLDLPDGCRGDASRLAAAFSYGATTDSTGNAFARRG